MKNCYCWVFTWVPCV